MDLSWLVIAVFLVWTLADGLFPSYYKGLAKSTYWWMGVAGALGLFVSIVFHEFWHSLVARRYGLQMGGITLFIFGGVSEMTEEPKSPGVEFFMAIAGPASSFALAGIFYLAALSIRGYAPVPVQRAFCSISRPSTAFSAFSISSPPFPLTAAGCSGPSSGMRKDELRWATRLASRIGEGFGAAMIFLGIIAFVSGNFISGVWWFLIGMFLRNASQMSYRQLLIRQALTGEHVQRFMKADLVTVSPSVTLSQLMEDYIYRYHYEMFPVVDGGKLLGVVNVSQLKEVPREEWDRRTVKELARTCARATP